MIFLLNQTPGLWWALNELAEQCAGATHTQSTYFALFINSIFSLTHYVVNVAWLLSPLPLQVFQKVRFSLLVHRLFLIEFVPALYRGKLQNRCCPFKLFKDLEIIGT